MRILAIDTAAQTASAAVIDGGSVMAECSINHKKTHSQKLMVIIERMMSDLELDISDIDLFAAAEGPGSFTGLRIGIATVKALAHSVNKPVIGVSTLEGLAYNMPYTNGIIVPIMDARNNQVFNAAYEWSDGVLQEITAPNVCTIDECVARTRGKNAVFTGDGVNIHADKIKESEIAPVNARLNRASSIAAAALVKAENGGAVRYTELVPKYLRLSQAERELKKRNALNTEGERK